MHLCVYVTVFWERHEKGALIRCQALTCGPHKSQRICVCIKTQASSFVCIKTRAPWEKLQMLACRLRLGQRLCTVRL